MTGLELKLLRVAADVKAKDLANAMGVKGPRISIIEGSRRPVTASTKERYLSALQTLATVPPDAQSAA